MTYAFSVRVRSPRPVGTDADDHPKTDLGAAHRSHRYLKRRHSELLAASPRYMFASRRRARVSRPASGLRLNRDTRSGPTLSLDAFRSKCAERTTHRKENRAVATCGPTHGTALTFGLKGPRVTRGRRLLTSTFNLLGRRQGGRARIGSLWNLVTTFDHSCERLRGSPYFVERKLGLLAQRG